MIQKTLLYRSLVFICLILTIATMGAQETFTIDFDWESVKHYNKFQQDFFYLCKLLEDSHPALYDEIPVRQFNKKKQVFAGSLELVVNQQKFAVMLQKFVSQLNDGHTQIYYANGFGEIKLPVKFLWSGDELLISNVNRGLDINLIGARVLQVGKYESDKLEQLLSPYVSAENRYWKRYRLASMMNTVGFLMLAGVIEEEDYTYLKINHEGKIKELNLSNQREVSWLNPVEHPVTSYKNKLFAYEILEKENICYFQFNEFLDLQTAKMYHESGLVSDSEYPLYHHRIEQSGGDFRIFLEKMFTDIYQNEVDNLVVDLRHNGGGNSILANQFFDHIKLAKPLESFSTGIMLSELMQHYYHDTVDYYLNNLRTKFGIIAELPYYYDLDLEIKEDYFAVIRNPDSGFYLPRSNHKYEGELYFITGNGTFSSAGDMVTIAYDNDLGKIVGEPMGQKPTSYGDILYFTLPHSGIEGSVSHKIFKRPRRSRNGEKTIYPDYPIEVDLKGKYLLGEDRAWDAIIELINQ